MMNDHGDMEAAHGLVWPFLATVVGLCAIAWWLL